MFGFSFHNVALIRRHILEIFRKILSVLKYQPNFLAIAQKCLSQNESTSCNAFVKRVDISLVTRTA